MKFYTLLLSLIVTLSMIGCTQVNTVVQKKPNPDGKIAIAPLTNETQTPFAGPRVANMIEEVMVSRGFQVIKIDEPEDTNLPLSLEELTRAAMNAGAIYLLVGNVNAWQQKTDIDTEPAVSVSLQIINLGRSEIIWSSSASSYKWNTSIGATARELIQNMMGE